MIVPKQLSCCFRDAYLACCCARGMHMAASLARKDPALLLTAKLLETWLRDGFGQD